MSENDISPLEEEIETVDVEISESEFGVIPGESRESINFIPAEQERTRSALARLVLWLLFFTIGLTFLTILLSGIFPRMKEVMNSDTRELITLILTTQVTLSGTALGFYFGGNQGK